MYSALPDELSQPIKQGYRMIVTNVLYKKHLPLNLLADFRIKHITITAKRQKKREMQAERELVLIFITPEVLLQDQERREIK